MVLPPCHEDGSSPGSTVWPADPGGLVERGRSCRRRCARCRNDCAACKKGRPLTASRLAPVEGMIVEARSLAAPQDQRAARGRRLISPGTTTSPPPSAQSCEPVAVLKLRSSRPARRPRMPSRRGTLAAQQASCTRDGRAPRRAGMLAEGVKDKLAKIEKSADLAV